MFQKTIPASPQEEQTLRTKSPCAGHLSSHEVSEFTIQWDYLTLLASNRQTNQINYALYTKKLPST
jgi:hypothetical protein